MGTTQSMISVFVWFSKFAFSRPVKHFHTCWIRHFDSIMFVWVMPCTAGHMSCEAEWIVQCAG